jgi:hypothetical protein
METRSVNRRLRSQSQPSTRRGQRSQQSAALGAADRSAHGFLSHRFAYLCGRKTLTNWKNRERDFYKSLSYLCDYYGFPAPVNDQPYPANIASELHRVRELLCDQSREYTLEVVEDDDGGICLMVEQVVDTMQDLYYIPVRPLWDMKALADRPAADLLMSVFAYLVEVVGVPFYTKYGYVAFQYDQLVDYYKYEYEDEEDTESVAECIAELDAAHKNGAVFYRNLTSHRHLHAFGRRLRRFKPVTPREQAIWLVATKLFALYKDYPTRRLEDTINEQVFITDDGEVDSDYEASERISVDMYVSFIWDFDYIHDQIVETFNQCEYANASGVDEPRTVIFFDQPHPKPTHDLTFDRALFTLIDELIAAMAPPKAHENNNQAVS